MLCDFVRRAVLTSLFAAAVNAQYEPRFVSNGSSAFHERLEALGLLGSHFGTVDVPQTFDYIVVGGGTAGLTIARRLAEHHSVAVIEAGSFYEINNANLTEIPAQASYYLGKDPALRNPLIDWNQHTTPQEGLLGDPVLYPQGRTLGGGSTRNFLWYQRGSAGSYSKWANEVGDDSYAFENFLEYFKRSVDFTPLANGTRPANATPKYDESYFSSSGGPLQVSFPEFASPSASWLALGLDAIGLSELPACMMDGNLLGWAWITNTIDPYLQIRSTSERSFLREAIRKTYNLLVYQNTLAKKIHFTSDGVANAVEIEAAAYGSGSVTYTLNATKEVIVSAGTFRSPQLLMVSGIGPAETLRENSIDVVADRPGVGQNLWDHLFFGPAYEVNTVTHSWLANPEYAAQAANEYITNHTGILTNVGGDLIAFEKLPNGTISNATRMDLDDTFGSDWPDIELLSLDAYTGTLNDFLGGAPDMKNYTAMCVALVAPFSRGNVSISSNDTAVHPLVNPNWLTDTRDQEVAIAGFKRARALFEAPGVQPVLVGSEAYPGQNVSSDDEILSMLRASSDTIHHAAGTCRMGKPSDSMAVLDSHARVMGVHGLRVVDASAFPLLPPGHPQSTVYALAEKIAADILRENESI
ncbi:hypothetical protein NU195Hw_g6767t1 [Hortaea werneckii]